MKLNQSYQASIFLSWTDILVWSWNSTGTYINHHMAGQEGQAQQVFTLEKGWGLTEGVDFLLLGLVVVL